MFLTLAGLCIRIFFLLYIQKLLHIPVQFLTFSYMLHFCNLFHACDGLDQGTALLRKILEDIWAYRHSFLLGYGTTCETMFTVNMAYTSIPECSQISTPSILIIIIRDGPFLTRKRSSADIVVAPHVVPTVRSPITCGSNFWLGPAKSFGVIIV